MSKKLSLREVLERPEEAKAEPRAVSGSPAHYVLRLVDVDRPVTFVRCLMSHGLSLRKGHGVISRLAEGEIVPVELCAPKDFDVVAELAELGVSATIVRRPDIDVRAVRERIGLSQAEFAMRFGFELDTIQNWEQGRNAPDAPAQILLKVIETHPDVVDEVLSAGKPRRKREKSTSRV